MSDNTTDEQETPPSKAELQRRIDRAWSDLSQSIASLTEAQWTAVRDAQGWSIKDHLVHISAWEQSLLALLEGRDRRLAMGLTEADQSTTETDEVNALIQQRNAHRSIEDVRAAFERSHQQVVDALAGMSDEDVFKPYSHYQPNDPPRTDAPVIAWIVGNTFEHYNEHQAWLRDLINHG